MIKQLVPSRICLKCQGCCRFSSGNSIWSPRILDEEKEKLDKKVRLIPHPKEGNFTPPLYTGAGFICASFNINENKCKIYRGRPFECKLYPFLINRKGKNVFLAVDLKCPFAAENLKSQRFKAYADYLIGFLNNPRSLNTLRNNLQIIQKYPEVLNLRELKS